MSIFGSLFRWFDPMRARRQQTEIRQSFEARPADKAPGVPDATVESAPARPPPPRVCRVCGFTDDLRFCPICLAESMDVRR